VKFYTKQRRKPTVPIITLIDILAILLIFFIVTTTFKKKESLVKVNLPQSSELASSGEADERISLAVNPEGKISLGPDPVTIESLPGALRALKQRDPEAKLELKADSNAPVGLMVQIWDAATKADVKIKDIPLRILLKE